MAEVCIREFVFERDYEAALRLWEGVGPGVRVGPSDSPAEMKKKLERDPDLFLIAELDGRLIGTVIGGFDGRRGLAYHLAVEGAHRQRGIGARLMEELERRLKAKGCIRCYLLVRPDNLGAVEFYQRQGWGLLNDLIFAKDLE